MDRVDAVVLTGGVAEHEPELMAELLGGLGVLGVDVARGALHACGDRAVSPPGVSPRVLVLAAREELEIARQTECLVGPGAQVHGARDFRP